MERETPDSATPVYYLLLIQGLRGMGNGNGKGDRSRLSK